MARSKKNGRSKARQRMAGSSITKRLKALEEVAKKQRGTNATVIKGIWTATLFSMDLVQIWQGLSPEMQAIIKAALSNTLARFMAQINGMSTDEQMVQAAELIKVIRTMERVMRELDPPVLSGYLSEHYFKEELEDAILDARLISEDLRAGKFRALHETWDIRTTMARRRDGQDGILPDVGLA